MPKIHVKKSIQIKAPKSELFKLLNDFNNWTSWSPWLILEPEAKLKIAPDAKSYSWEGKRIGSGEMKILSESPESRIDYDLVFLKPWKSKAKVSFLLIEKDQETEVTWLMDSSIPFFLFWMKKMMEGFVGMDFQRGLYLLKDVAEDGKPHSKLDFKGIEQFEGCNWVGIKSETNMTNLSKDMSNDFKKLNDWAEKNRESISGEPFSIYHKWDFANGKVVYTSGFQVREKQSSVPEGFIQGLIPKTRVNVIKHTGPYKHLGNVWGAQYSMHRSKTFKMKKGIHPFETYQNMPGTVPDNELETTVNFPCK